MHKMRIYDNLFVIRTRGKNAAKKRRNDVARITISGKVIPTLQDVPRWDKEGERWNFIQHRFVKFQIENDLLRQRSERNLSLLPNFLVLLHYLAVKRGQSLTDVTMMIISQAHSCLNLFHNFHIDPTFWSPESYGKYFFCLLTVSVVFSFIVIARVISCPRMGQLSFMFY